MRKFWKILLAFFLLFAFTVPVQAAQVDMWAYVYKWDGGYNADGTLLLKRVTSGITFKVLAIDSDTAETLFYYNNRANTELTNPVTTTSYNSSSICNDRVAFSVDPTDTTNDRYVDLIVVNTDGGYTAFYEDFDKNNHTIVIDQRPGVPHTGIIWWGHSALTQIDTGIDFEYDTLIKDVRVEVVSTCSGCTIDVGLGLSSETSYDYDGLRDNVLQTTANFVEDTGFITDGSTVDYYPVSTYGVFLYTKITGTDALTYSGSSVTNIAQGGRTYIGHVIKGTDATSLTYAVSSTASGGGYIYYEFVRLR